jgi:tryptophan synthase alpha chain
MDRISKLFDGLKGGGRSAFVGYITAGDPDFDTSLDVADVLASHGVDMLELGVPFSDPLADGEANQLAAARALESGMTPLRVLELARGIRGRHPDLPLVLFTYLNPVANLAGTSFSEFCRMASDAGVDAILPLDLPPEELSDACSADDGSSSYGEAIRSSGLKLVSLVAPNTPDARIPVLTGVADGFIYLISREGVTGEGDSFSADFADRLDAVRRETELPVVVGFGISTPDHVAEAVATGVDGVVVGSAIVRRVEALAAGRGTLDDLGSWISTMTSGTA